MPVRVVNDAALQALGVTAAGGCSFWDSALDWDPHWYGRKDFDAA